MSSPPKDTHGPIVETGPTRGQNRSRNKDGRWRAKRSDAGHERAGTTPPDPRQGNLSLWFWGTIGVLFAATLALTIAAFLNRGTDEPIATAGEAPTTGDTAVRDPRALREALDPAVILALDGVNRRMHRLVDTAFEPVYAAIPQYADFHYSVFGEYTELAAAALSRVEGGLQSRLLSGLDGRLSAISPELQALFERLLEEGLSSNLADRGGSAADAKALKDSILASTKERIVFTLPANTAAVVGTKVAASVVAKSIAKKLAIKAVAKTGTKVGAVLTGAGSGAVACLASGLGATACVVVGGVGAWFATDHVIVKLDEYWTRDEFEADLRGLVDAQKAKVKEAFDTAFVESARKVGNATEQVLQDMTLAELYSPENCSAAKDMIDRYDPLRENLRERSTKSIAALRADLPAVRDHAILGPIARQIEANLRQSGPLTITSLVIKGNLPPDDRDDNALTGRITLNARQISIDNTIPTVETGLEITLNPDLTVEAGAKLNYALALEQDNWFNSFFGSAASVDLFTQAEISAGLSPQATLSTFIAKDDDAGSLEDVNVVPISGEPLTLTFSLTAAPLDPVPLPKVCQGYGGP